MRKAEDLIQSFLDSIGQAEGGSYSTLFRTWPEIVGEHIAAHSAPVDVRGTSLVIETDHPGWTQMIMIKQATILAQLKRRVPEITITGVTVRVRNDGGSTSHEAQAPEPAIEPAPPPTPPSADEKQALERIKDDEMRQTLRRLRDDLGGAEKNP